MDYISIYCMGIGLILKKAVDFPGRSGTVGSRSAERSQGRVPGGILNL